MKYLITGNAGAGKSTCANELSNLGFTAYDTDSMEGVSRLINLKTGKPAEWPDPPIDWSRYSWDWQEAEIKKLLASDDTVFIAALVGNQEKFYGSFDRVFALITNTETLKHRLLTREKDYGKHPQQLAGILDWHKTFQDDLLSEPKAMAIDASQPMKKVVAEILKNTDARR